MDVKALRAGGQLVIAHQGRFDVVDPHWGAADRTPSIEMDDRCGCQVSQCLGQVAQGQGCVRVADSLHIRVLGHGCFMVGGNANSGANADQRRKPRSITKQASRPRPSSRRRKLVDQPLANRSSDLPDDVVHKTLLVENDRRI